MCYTVMTKDTNSRLDASYQYSTASVGSVIGAICLVVVAFGFSLSHVIWHQSEFLALEIRAAGSAIATTSCWLANLVISVSYLSLMK
jgi:SP family myo-inositol transporter-like MFS transporter 13